MTEPFVPFVKAQSKTSSADDSFRLRVLPQSQQTAAFRPVQTGPAGIGLGHCAQEPQVTLERDGNRITRITIQCACGQVLELNCTY